MAKKEKKILNVPNPKIGKAYRFIFGNHAEMIGILTASLPLIYWQSGAVAQLMLLPAFWYGFIILVSYLMVMKTPMLALKGLANKRKLVIPLLLVAIEIVLTAFFYKWLAIPFGFMGYCLVSLLYKKTIIQ